MLRNIEYEQQVADAVYPYAKWTMIGLTAGRLILMLVSVKYLSITKVYIYYEMLVVITGQFLPQDINAQRGNLFLYNTQSANFIDFYFSWWPSLLSLLISQVTYTSSRIILFADEAHTVSGILNFASLVFACLAIHIVISWVGQVYTDSLVQATGNEEILNDFEEAIVILDEKNGKQLFTNTEAHNIMNNQKGVRVELQCLDKSKKQFAFVANNSFIPNADMDSLATI